MIYRDCTGDEQEDDRQLAINAEESNTWKVRLQGEFSKMTLHLQDKILDQLALDRGLPTVNETAAAAVAP